MTLWKEQQQTGWYETVEAEQRSNNQKDKNREKVNLVRRQYEMEGERKEKNVL